MARFQQFEDIEAWQKARLLAADIYACSRRGLFARDYALCNQMRAAAVSIMSNIAEGFERDGNREFVQFLAIAKGSCGELRAQLCVAKDQDYLSLEDFGRLAGLARETSRMIAGLMRYLRHSQRLGHKFE